MSGAEELVATWPGGAGWSIETYVPEVPTTFSAWAIRSALLSCCPRNGRVQLIADSGSSNLSTTRWGSFSATFSTMTAGATVAVRACTAFRLRQGSSGCAGQPFRLKFCISAVSNSILACGPAGLFARECGPTASYVDIVGGAAG